MMIIAILTIFAGMPFGFLFKNNKSLQYWVGQFLNFSVWLLLLLLGVGLGSDASIISQLDTLGLQALLITIFATMGTLVGAWFMGRYVFMDSFLGGFTSQTHHQRASCPLETPYASVLCTQSLQKTHNERALGKSFPPKEYKLDSCDNVNSVNDGEKQSKFTALKDSVIVLSFFIGGALLGMSSFIPKECPIEDASEWALYLLLFLAGMSVGFDLKAFRILRELKGKILLIPFVTILGTLLASPLACLIFPDLRIIDAMAVGSGLGYYSLSSTMISQAISPALGSVALLANMFREIFTLIFCPLMIRYFGRLAPVMVGGATSNDSSLPVIAKYCGERYAIIAIFSGVFLSLFVPLLVSLILYFA